MINLKFDLINKFDEILSDEFFSNEQPVGKFGNNKFGTTKFYLNNKEKEIMSRNLDYENKTLSDFNKLENFAKSISKNLDNLDEGFNKIFSETLNNVKNHTNNVIKKINESEYIDYQLDNLFEAKSLTKNNIRSRAKEDAVNDSKKADRAKLKINECREKISKYNKDIKLLQQKIKVARKPEIYKEQLINKKKRLQKALQNLKDAQIALRKANASKKETLKSKSAKHEAKRNERNYKSALSKSNSKLKAKYNIA